METLKQLSEILELPVISYEYRRGEVEVGRYIPPDQLLVKFQTDGPYEANPYTVQIEGVHLQYMMLDHSTGRAVYELYRGQGSTLVKQTLGVINESLTER